MDLDLERLRSIAEVWRLSRAQSGRVAGHFIDSAWRRSPPAPRPPDYPASWKAPQGLLAAQPPPQSPNPPLSLQGLLSRPAGRHCGVAALVVSSPTLCELYRALGAGQCPASGLGRVAPGCSSCPAP